MYASVVVVVVVVRANRFGLRGSNADDGRLTLVGAGLAAAGAAEALSNESSKDCGLGVRPALKAGRRRVPVEGRLEEASTSSPTLDAVVLDVRVPKLGRARRGDGAKERGVELDG